MKNLFRRVIAPATIALPVIAAGIAFSQAGLEPLPIALPKPLFEGTPENLRVPNLERPLGRPRPAFLAPAGVVNVAKGKPVLYTGPEPAVGDLEMITDGVKTGIDGSYVEVGANLQHVTIDLEAPHTIYAILAWHFLKQPRVYNDVIIRVADDPDFLTNVRTIFNNDHDNTAGLGIGKELNYIETAEGKLVDAKGIQAQYVRLYTNGNHVNTANHYVEVEVFGKPLN